MPGEHAVSEELQRYAVEAHTTGSRPDVRTMMTPDNEAMLTIAKKGLWTRLASQAFAQRPPSEVCIRLGSGIGEPCPKYFEPILPKGWAVIPYVR